MYKLLINPAVVNIKILSDYLVLPTVSIHRDGKREWWKGDNHTQEEAEIILTDVVDNRATIEADIAEVTDKTARIRDAYNQMNTDVITEMVKTFATDKSDSAIAFKESWVDMLLRPSAYSPEGLTARFDIGSLVIGDALDTDEKIIEYATGCMDNVNVYAIFRMKRIEQFRSEKAEIEAE